MRAKRARRRVAEAVATGDASAAAAAGRIAGGTRFTRCDVDSGTSNASEQFFPHGQVAVRFCWIGREVIIRTWKDARGASGCNPVDHRRH